MAAGYVKNLGRLSDMLVAAFSGTDGALQWAANFYLQQDPLAVAAGNAVAIDSAGSVFVAGFFSIGPNFDDQSGAFLSLDGSDGAERWRQTFHPIVGSTSFSSVAVDASGNPSACSGFVADGLVQLVRPFCVKRVGADGSDL